MPELTPAYKTTVCRDRAFSCAFMAVILTCLLILLIHGNSLARVLHVPDNFESIQTAIDSCTGGDTIIVSPGTYLENVSFSDKSVTVASLFLVTGNAVYIDSTIIDGDENGQSVISIRDSQGQESRINGFTITDGLSDYGGGIYIRDSSPRLENLIIKNNTAQRNGGGIYNTRGAETNLFNVIIEYNTAHNGGGGISVYQLSNVSMRNCRVASNSADVYGGGIQCSNANANLENVVVKDNNSGQYGGGIHSFGLASVQFNGGMLTGNSALIGGAMGIWNESIISANYVLISGNSATSGGAIWIEFGSLISNNSTISDNAFENDGVVSISGASQVLFANSILWNNQQPVVMTQAADDAIVEVTFCDVEDGQNSFVFDGGEFHWAEGNIIADPQFIEIGDVNYHLHENSPCIDSGNPEAPPDADGSRPDIGAFPFFRGGTLEGYVFSSVDDHPLDNARVTTSNGIFAETDHEGFWRIPNARAANFSLTASASGFTDSTEFDIQLGQDDVMQVEFSLRLLEFTPLFDRDILEVSQGSSRAFPFNIGRNGTGVLEWNLDHRLGGEANVDKWKRSRLFPVGQQIEDYRIEAVAFVTNQFYVSAINPNGADWIKVFNYDGEFVTEFRQEGDADAGITDLTWDGELIWGSGERRVFGYSPDGELVRSFDGPYDPNRAITWDSGHGTFWTGSNNEDFAQVDPEGDVVSNLNNPGFEVTGLSYWQEDPDGYNLYISHQAGESISVHKMNIANGDTIFVSSITNPEGGISSGSFISSDFYQLTTVFLTAFHSTGEADGDRIDVFLMDANLDWISYNPNMGLLNPNRMLQVNLVINSRGFDLTDYEAELVFNHNGAISPVVIPINVTVTNPLSEDIQIIAVPEIFGLSAPYPNPFNSQTTLKYFIEAPGIANIVIFDVDGRVIETLKNEWHKPGSYEILFNAGCLSSGVYFAKLTAGGSVNTRKLIYIR